jgi:uncharacterized repeat protein (TIGR01451 family)
MKKTLLKMLMLAAGVAVIASMLPSNPAIAQAVQISTPYPAVSVEAGKTVTFNLDVFSATRQRVALAVVETPPNWQATLRGGGFVINGVTAGPRETGVTPPQVQLEVRVPPDAAKADYRVIVRANAGGAIQDLQVDVRVAEVAAGAVTLTPEFPTLKGGPDQTFRFNITLTNNTPESTTFDLSATGPEGWTLNARPSGQTQASTVKVDGGQTSQVEVEADPPDQATAGTYEIKATAQSGSTSAETTITAEITGNVTLVLTTPDERLNTSAVAGKATEFQIVVRNDGTSAVENVELTSTPPSDWRVTFSPRTITKIDAKKSQRVTARITPSGDSVAGDYVLTLSASSGGASDDVEVRTTVRTSRLWGFIGILVILAAGYILFRVFRQYGRR